MRWKMQVITLCSAEFLAAGQQMDVTVCNLNDVLESIITNAKAETQLVFRSAGVEIVWSDCKVSASPTEPWFVIRLRTGKRGQTAGPFSPDVMGEAFVVKRGEGYMADAYLDAIQDLAERHGGDAGVLLGFVMAHELGHLLLGPGHAPAGVMRAAWGGKELKAMRQRWLKFDKEGAARVRSELQARAKRSDAELRGR
jgi:hypothetical protein